MRSRAFSRARKRVFEVLVGSALVSVLMPENHKRPVAPELFNVAIDAGHSLEDGGAVSARGRSEYEFNRRIADLLVARLSTMQGIIPFLVNPSGAALPLTSRTRMANERGAGLFLSIHHDSVQPSYLSHWEFEKRVLPYCDRFAGYSVFFSRKNGAPFASLSFANLLGGALRNRGFTPTLHHAEPIPGENRELVNEWSGVYRFDDLVVLRSCEVPAVLVECGVIVNRDEEVLLSNEVYRRVLVQTIAEAVRLFRENAFDQTNSPKIQRSLPEQFQRRLHAKEPFPGYLRIRSNRPAMGFHLLATE